MNEQPARRPTRARRQEQVSENPKNQLQSAAKVFGRDLSELTVTEVTARAGLDHGTAFRLIHALIGPGYLRPVPDGRRFRPTLKCLEPGFSTLSAGDLPGHSFGATGIRGEGR